MIIYYQGAAEQHKLLSNQLKSTHATLLVDRVDQHADDRGKNQKCYVRHGIFSLSKIRNAQYNTNTGVCQLAPSTGFEPVSTSFAGKHSLQLS